MKVYTGYLWQGTKCCYSILLGLSVVVVKSRIVYNIAGEMPQDGIKSMGFKRQKWASYFSFENFDDISVLALSHVIIKLYITWQDSIYTFDMTSMQIVPSFE